MTSALPEPGASSPEDHVAISRGFLAQASAELAQGHRLQASEKAWAAVAHALKSVAKERGWNNIHHRQVMDVGAQLAQEFQKPSILTSILHGDSLHRNFYENRMRGDEIRFFMAEIEDFLSEIEEVRAEGPRQFTIEDGDQRARLRSLTGNAALQIGDSSPAGFSNDHSPGLG